MGKKCIIKGCRTNYRLTQDDCVDKNKAKVFRFPSKAKRASDRERWIRSIPLLMEKDIDNMTTPVICEKHWPIDYRMEKGDGGKMRPVDPPSVFEGFAQSSIPTPPSKPRPTKTRTRRDDELAEFKKADVIHDFDAFTDELKHNRRKLSANIISFKSDDALWVQSLSYVSGIPSFSIRVSRDLSFQSFFMGIQCTVVTFSKKTVSPE